MNTRKAEKVLQTLLAQAAELKALGYDECNTAFARLMEAAESLRGDIEAAKKAVPATRAVAMPSTRCANCGREGRAIVFHPFCHFCYGDPTR